MLSFAFAFASLLALVFSFALSILPPDSVLKHLVRFLQKSAAHAEQIADPITNITWLEPKEAIRDVSKHASSWIDPQKTPTITFRQKAFGFLNQVVHLRSAFLTEFVKETPNEGPLSHLKIPSPRPEKFRNAGETAKDNPLR